jgi:hypothetical protein
MLIMNDKNERKVNGEESETERVVLKTILSERCLFSMIIHQVFLKKDMKMSGVGQAD